MPAQGTTHIVNPTALLLQYGLREQYDDYERADNPIFGRAAAFAQKSPAEFEAEVRLLLAAKLFELNQVSTGVAARLAGMSRVAFTFELARFGLSPLGQEPAELEQDVGNA